MQPESGRLPEPSGETLFPPAITQWQPLAETDNDAGLPLAPFVPGAGASESESSATVEAEYLPEVVVGEWYPEDADPDFTLEDVDLSDDASYDGDAVVDDDSFFDGDAAPAIAVIFDGPADDGLEEDTLVLMEEITEGETDDRMIADEVAARLEVLAGRLRESGFAALNPRSGDAVDAVLAAVLSGYVAARAR